MPLIRIDDEVYQALQRNAVAFEDTPNAVLRRLIGVDLKGDARRLAKRSRSRSEKRSESLASRNVTARKLANAWKVQIAHGLYHRDGTFFENLTAFPGALFDPGGYIVFKTESEYLRSPYLRIGQKLNVPSGIASIPGYVKIGR